MSRDGIWKSDEDIRYVCIRLILVFLAILDHLRNWNDQGCIDALVKFTRKKHKNVFLENVDLPLVLNCAVVNTRPLMPRSDANWRVKCFNIQKRKEKLSEINTNWQNVISASLSHDIETLDLCINKHCVVEGMISSPCDVDFAAEIKPTVIVLLACTTGTVVLLLLMFAV